MAMLTAGRRRCKKKKKKKCVPSLTAVHCMQGEAGGMAGGVAFAYGSEQERRGEGRARDDRRGGG